MRTVFRSLSLLLLPSLLFLCLPASASSSNEILPDAQMLTQLEQRAQLANPRDQCFLYTELIQTMTEIAGRQLREGDTDEASATLKKIGQYAQLIHMELGGNSKRVKNAEMLLERTTYRMGEYLRQASFEDKASIQLTLKQLQQIHNELLAQVFKH